MSITIIFCRDDPISSRWTGIDSLLTEYQVDNNFFLLKDAVETLRADFTTTVSLSTITQPTASSLLFTLTDATTFGPFELPVAVFDSKVTWAIDTPYLINDTFNAPDGGLYRVLYPHTSSHTSFDPAANDGMGNDYYAPMIPPRGNVFPAGGAVGMYLRKNSTNDYDFNAAFISSFEVTYSPSTSSTLISTNAGDALEELDERTVSLDTRIDTLEAGTVAAIDVSYTPSTDTALVSTNVGDALDEIAVTYLPLAGGTMAGAITLAADPASALQPATKQYVDGLALNLGKRARVRAATTANITIATALNNGDSLDGVTLATGDLVLVKNQSAPEENGIYVVGVSPTRFAEFDTYDEHPGSLIAVEEGSTNADTLWLCTSNAGGTLNTTAIAFTSITISGALLAANNLSDLANAATARSNIGLSVGTIEVVIDGGGSTITTGLKGYLSVPIAGTITEAKILLDQSGSIVIDVWKCTYSQFDSGGTHPVSGDKITASAPPTVSTATKSQDTTLTGWTTAFSAGDVLAFNVNSVTSAQRATLSLKYTK